MPGLSLGTGLGLSPIKGGGGVPSVFADGVWNDDAIWNDTHIWKDAA